MPVAVDHAEKRKEVIAVAARLIADAGLEGVTVRDVAEASGCSTAIVSHYFRNKRELLILTYDASIEQATARCEAALARSGGALRAYLGELMPLDEERRIEWKIWLAFWAKALADREIAKVQRACVATTRARLAQIIQDAVGRGAIGAEVDIEAAARQLLTAIMGMAVQVLFDPADWPATRQHALVAAELAQLGAAPAAAGPRAARA